MGKKSPSAIEQNSKNTSEFPKILSLSEVPALLQEKESELKSLHKRMLELFEAEHVSSDVDKLQKAVLKVEKELVILEDTLVSTKALTADGTNDKGQRNVLGAQCAALMERVEKIDRRLADDRSALQQKESKEAIDLLKALTFLAVFPAAAATFTRAVFGDKSSVVPYAAWGVAAVGICHVFQKRIVLGWKTSQKAICDAPQIVRDSFLVYYVKAQMRSKLAAAKDVFHRNANAVARPGRRLSKKARKNIHGLQGPL